MRFLQMACGLAAAGALVWGAPQDVAKPPTDGLVGHWRLDEKEGPQAPDSSGKGNHGTHKNGAKVHADSRSVSFDGKNAYVRVGDYSVLAMKGAFTVAAWVYPTGRGEGGAEGETILNKEGEYELGISPIGTVQFALANEALGWTWVDTGHTVLVKEWTHLAWTYSAADKSLKVFANGNEVFSAEGTGEIVDQYFEQNELWIGGRQKDGGVEFFAGRIADVRLYNRARKAAEIESVCRVRSADK